ncbi:MAG: hypothetical protein ABSH38_06760 [Verrucomicrobiota bacterium]|jgi:hypothetical protein
MLRNLVQADGVVVHFFQFTKIALDNLIETKQGATKERWLRAAKDKALLPLLDRIIAETQAEHLFAALKAGTVSTNVHLRKLHNFAIGMGWLPRPIVHKRQWPEIFFKEKRVITWKEHQAIIASEMNPERRAFYEFCWHLGGAQSDVASLTAEDIDWQLTSRNDEGLEVGRQVKKSFSSG